MGVVDNAVEDGVGERRVADHGMPTVDRKLTGDQGGAAPVAVLDDLEQVVSLLGTERLETPVVEDKELDAAEGAHEAGITAIAFAEGQIAEQPWDALVEHGAVVAAGLVAKGAGQPALADPGRPFDDQVLRLLDPSPTRERLEEGAVEPACRAVIDVLDRSLMAQAGVAQTSLEPAILPVGCLMVEEQPEPFGLGEIGRFGIGGEADKGAGHAVQAELVKLIEGRVGQQGDLLLVIAGTADVGVVEGERALSGARGGVCAIEAVLQDGVDRAVGARADVEAAVAGGFETIASVLACQAEDAEAGPEALLRVRLALQDQCRELAR